MTDVQLLRKKIEESGYKLRFIASKIGITYACLLKKINNQSEFKASEIMILCDLLNIGLEEKEHIFFTSIVDV